jgi:hypothetical protein
MVSELWPDGLWELVESFIPAKEGEAERRTTAPRRQSLPQGNSVRPAPAEILGKCFRKNLGAVQA